MTTFLVTGAAGFIGSNLCRALLAAGHDVRGLDDFSSGRRENLVGLEAMDFREGDINDVPALRQVMTGVEIVFHQAALVSVPRSVADPQHTHRVNVTGTLALLEAARAAGVRRVVYASSSAVYGDNPASPKREAMLPEPNSPYAVSKAANELYARTYTTLYGLECVGLRYFNVYGPFQDPQGPYAAAIPIFVTRLLGGEAPVIFGDGRQTRDFVFIDDVVAANLAAATTPYGAGEVFNVAGGTAIDLLALLGELNQLLGQQIAPAFAPPRAGDVRESVAAIDKAERILGFRPRIGLREGLARTLAWFRSQANNED